ncbi:MAG: hypothetical protein Q4B10_06175 [Actinomycetaceae bacterium]|nr:hypothetical protein [Actinomycetaceae bacterium]
MTERTGRETEAGKRVWFVGEEETPETRPTLSHDDAIIAGGAIGETQTLADPVAAAAEAAAAHDVIGESDLEETTVLPAAEESTPHEPAAADEAPTVALATENAEAPEQKTDDTEEETERSKATTEGEMTRVRRQSLLSMSDPEPSDDDQPTGSPQTSTSSGAEESAATAPLPVAQEDEEKAERPRHDAAATPSPLAPAPTPAPLAPTRIDDTIFEGATQLPSIPSRVPAHLWSLLLTLVLLPVAWFFATDGVTRLFPASLETLPHTVSNWAGVGEIGAAALAVFLLILLARRSSLGAFVWGTVATLIGIAGMVATAQIAPYLDPSVAALRRVNDFFGNIAHHLVVTLPTGIIALAGIVLIGIGFVSHGARRAGRRDYVAHRTIERMDS